MLCYITKAHEQLRQLVDTVETNVEEAADVTAGEEDVMDEDADDEDVDVRKGFDGRNALIIIIASRSQHLLAQNSDGGSLC